MSSSLVSLRVVTMFAASLSLSLVGCGLGGNTGLPETVTLELLDGTIIEAEEGGGAASLANSQWRFFRSGSNRVFVTINFGPNGELESFADNTFSPEVLGDTILFDGQRHGSTQQGLEYAATTFGAESDDATGFAFEAQLALFFSGFNAANATLTAAANYDPADPDYTVTGTFKFSMQVSIPSIPPIPDDEFEFVGHRVTE